ncbi:hypothetical protein B6U93_04490 [Candidatus Woesearchaeota archaeon ex4484_78]|nr:MAG: hypothetical protein B6U93_04490 [Candidatus Woesearchaeota archaeon ex4484_78]
MFKNLFVFVFVSVMFSITCNAAILSGSIYGPDLELLSNVIVDINSTPRQFFVAKQGEYEFNLNPGSYSVEAKYYENGILAYHGFEDIEIVDNGSFILDLLLLPPEDELLENDELEDFNLDIGQAKTANSVFFVFSLAVFLLVLFLVFLFFKKMRKKKKVKKDLPDDLKQALSIIKQHDGRISQKELRKNIPLRNLLFLIWLFLLPFAGFFFLVQLVLQISEYCIIDSL